MTTKSSLRNQLLTVFPVEQADVLASVVVEAQDWLATKADVKKLHSALTELSMAQQRTEEKVGELADSLKATQKLVGDLAVSQQFMGSQVATLNESHQKMMIHVERADGRSLEWSLQTRLPAYVGRWIKRCRVLEIQEIVESLEQAKDTGVRILLGGRLLAAAA